MDQVYNPFTFFAYRLTLEQYQQHMPLHGGTGGFFPNFPMDTICPKNNGCGGNYIRGCEGAGGTGGCFPHPNNPDKEICWCNPAPSSSLPTAALDFAAPGQQLSYCPKGHCKDFALGCNDGGGHMCGLDKNLCKCCPGSGQNSCA